MIDKIKYAAKLSLLGAGSFLKLFALGVISAGLTFIVGLVLLLNATKYEVENVNSDFFLIALFKIYPLLTVLLLAIVASVFLIFSISSKYAMQKIACKLVNDKAESLLYPIMDKALDKTVGNIGEEEKRNLIQKGFDFSMMQVKVIDNVKNDTENKWVRRLLVFGFEKLSLDDIAFNDPNLNIREEIKTKVMGFIKDIAQPDKGLFWYLVLFHWVALGVVIFMR